MKKIIIIVSLFIMATILAGCAQDAGGDKPTNETFSKTTVYNPNATKVKLKGVSKARSVEEGDEICEVEPLQTKEVELGNEHEYYFTDAEGNKIADLSKSDSGQYLPVYLELNEPKEGKEYLLLNQYKTANILETSTFINSNNETYETYGLLLYEVIGKNDPDAYQYDANTYIRIYPSANYWIDSKGYATNKIGTKVTIDDELINNFIPLSNEWVAWGWSTYNTDLDMWFCHRVTSCVLSAKDGDTYEVKEINQQKNVEHISVQNVSNGIQVKIKKTTKDPQWKYGTVEIIENENVVGCSYSYFVNGKCLLDDNGNTLTFLFPFTTKDAEYTFKINPFYGCEETVSIIADYSSTVQLQNLNDLRNFKVSYKEDGNKRIVKINMDPLNIFTKPENIKYNQLCLNTYNSRNEWVYNFGHNDMQFNKLLSDGIDFISPESNLYILKSADEFKQLLNKGNKIIFQPHIQFNTEPYSEDSGNFIINLGNFEFEWSKIN